MLSGILPSTSSSTKSGSSKPSSRFSVRIFKTPSNVPMPYPINANFDVGYRSGQPEQHAPTWYPTSAVNAPYDARPRSTANYTIYPSALNDTYIYEQSTCSKSDIFSNSEFETSTTTLSPTSAFSPALSTDSTMTLKSPSVPDLTLHDHHTSMSAHPSPRPLPSILSSQGPTLSKTPSARPYALQSHPAILIRVPANLNEPMTQIGPPLPGGYPIDIPEYAASTLSEIEVEERDRIAQINAGYNSASTASFYASSTGSAGDIGTHLVSTTPQNPRTVTSQPLHPTNLPFPIRPQEDFTHSAFPRPSLPSGPAHPALRNSPPNVERIPSQLPSEQLVSQNAGPSQSSYFHSTQGDSWSRDATIDSDSRLTNAHYPPQSVSAASSRSYISRAAQEVAGHFATPIEVPRQHSIADRSSSFAGGRVDVKDYGLPHAGSDYRANDPAAPTRGSAEPTRSSPRGDYIYAKPDPESRRDISPPRGPSTHVTSQDSASRAATASDLRRDTRTPTPRDSDDRRPPYLTRRGSFSGEMPRDGRSKSLLTPDRELFTSGPLTSSPTQIRLSPTDFDATTPTRSRDVYGPADSSERPPGRIRTRSISFSSATRPTFTLSTSNVSQSTGHHAIPILSQPAPPRGSAGKTSDMPSEHDRHGRSSSDRSSPKITASSNHTTRMAYAAESDRRSSAHYTSTQVPTTSQQELRQSATLQTSSSTANSSSKAGDRMPAATPSGLQLRSNRDSYYIVQPQLQIHLEPHRRHSDGDRPCNTTSILRSATTHEKPGSSSSSSSSSNSHSNSKSGGQSRPSTPSGQLPEYQRRFSDGDQKPPLRPVLPRLDSAPLARSVRWNENLICPSPIFPSQRRKGWFNRRGDQLWTNDGGYVAASKHEQYPPDLDEYPEHGEGWMNEEGTRIDMGHHLIPKLPLRSALKQTKN